MELCIHLFLPLVGSKGQLNCSVAFHNHILSCSTASKNCKIQVPVLIKIEKGFYKKGNLKISVYRCVKSTFKKKFGGPWKGVIARLEVNKTHLFGKK